MPSILGRKRQGRVPVTGERHAPVGGGDTGTAANRRVPETRVARASHACEEPSFRSNREAALPLCRRLSVIPQELNRQRPSILRTANNCLGPNAVEGRFNAWWCADINLCDVSRKHRSGTAPSSLIKQPNVHRILQLRFAQQRLGRIPRRPGVKGWVTSRRQARPPEQRAHQPLPLALGQGRWCCPLTSPQLPTHRTVRHQ